MWMCITGYLERDCEGSIGSWAITRRRSIFYFLSFIFLVYRRDAGGDLFQKSLLHAKTNTEEF